MKFSPRTWLLLGILYTCYIIYGTLLPFNFSFSFEFIQNNLGNIEWIEQYGRSYFITKNIDAIANIFFFIPLGIIIYNARYALGHNRRYIFDIVLATLSGFFLSLIVEFLQLLIEERRTSLLDILMNTLGCFSGAILGYIINQILAQSARQKIEVFIRNIPTVILILPFLLVSLFISEKFSFNFVKSKNIENNYFNWDYIFRPIWIWLILYVYIPIGMLITRIIKNRFGRYPLSVIYLISIFVAVTITSIIELIKYVGHITSVPQVNIFFGIFGLLIGIAFSEVLLRDRFTLNKTENRQIVTILSGIYLFLGLIILYKSAYPFDFNLSRTYLFDKTLFSFLSMYSFIPFSGFQKLFIYSAQNILLFIPVGIILCELELYLSKKKKVILLVTSSILLILIPFAIQILNKNLTPFLYEIPTNVFGIFTGYFIWYGFRRGSQPF